MGIIEAIMRFPMVLISPKPYAKKVDLALITKNN